MRLEEFYLQDLTNTAWAFATLGLQEEEFLGAIVGMALVRLKAQGSKPKAQSSQR